MFTLRALLLVVPTLVLYGDTFPAPLSPERPVSEAVAGPATGRQSDPVIVSNGELALAAWSDWRRGYDQAYAARIDAQGRVLDPAGILLLERGVVDGMTWNGTHFVAVTRRDRLAPYVLVFIAPDGSEAGRRVLDVPIGYEFEDAGDPGADVRLLFVSNGALAAVVTGEGDVVAAAVPILGPGDSGYVIAAGSRGQELLLLHRRTTAGTVWSTFATRIDATGRVLSSHDPALGMQFAERGTAVEGGAAGWLFVSQQDNGLRLQQLDERGVAAGPPTTLVEPRPGDVGFLDYRPRIVRESGGHTIAWHRTLDEDDSAAYAAHVADNGAPGPVRLLHEWDALSMSVALASAGGHRVLLTGIWRLPDATNANIVAQTLSAGLEAGAPVPLAYTPPAQREVAIAAGQNGYLTAWTEEGGDAFMRVVVRRILPNGQPQGAPVEVLAADAFTHPGSPDIASNGSTYLVTWRAGDHAYGRRLVASTGEWLDAAPFTITTGTTTVASNGSDFLAVWAGECGNGWCIHARRIAGAGEPLVEPATAIATAEDANGIAIASNGTDYLVVWEDGFLACEPDCSGETAFLAARLRADATKLDPEPLVLLRRDGGTPETRPAVAWNRGRYLVAWTDGANVDGAFVTAEGSIVERATLAKQRAGDLLPHLAAWRDRFVLFTREVVPVAGTPSPAWIAVAFSADRPLDRVAALPRTMVVHDGGDVWQYGMLAATTSGSAMLVAYVRNVDPAAGGVSRAFTRLYGNYGTRRRVVR